MRDEVLVAAQDRDALLRLLANALARKLSQMGVSAARIDENTSLLAVGVIDSQSLLDMILEAEESSGRTFDPMRIDFESGVTLGTLAGAFT